MDKDIISDLEAALRNYDSKESGSLTQKAMEDGVDPLKVLDALTEVMRDIGDSFNKGALFLPELFASARAMQSATLVLNKEIMRQGIEVESLGTVVIGTVFGDIHDIGKAMVSTLLTAGGFSVYDLGVNVKAEEFMSAIEKHKADILGMSALLTTTAMQQRKVIEQLKAKGLREKIKIMVGGAPIDDAFAKRIGADGYAPTAPLAVELARALINKL